MFFECFLKFAVCFSVLIELAWDELRTAITIQFIWRDLMPPDCGIQHDKWVSCCCRVKQAVAHDLSWAIVKIADELFAFEPCFHRVPISVPHEVRDRPLVTLVFARFSSFQTRLLKAFSDENLTYFSKRNTKATLFEDSVKLSCAAALLIPLVNNFLVELRIEWLKKPARLMVFKTIWTKFLVRLPDLPDGNSAYLLSKRDIFNWSLAQLTNDPSTFFSSNLYAILSSITLENHVQKSTI